MFIHNSFLLQQFATGYSFPQSRKKMSFNIKLLFKICTERIVASGVKILGFGVINSRPKNSNPKSLKKWL